MSVRVLLVWKRGFKVSIVRMWLGWPSARFVSVRYWDRFSASPRDPTSCYYDITRRLSTFPNVHFAASPVKSSTLSNNLLLLHTHNYTDPPHMSLSICERFFQLAHTSLSHSFSSSYFYYFSQFISCSLLFTFTCRLTISLSLSISLHLSRHI